MSDKPHICYLGHEDCYDQHTSHRLADEADWQEERERDLGGWWPRYDVVPTQEGERTKGRDLVPSEKEIQAAAVEAVVETLWDEVKMPYDVTRIDLTDIIAEALDPFLSAAEKEREEGRNHAPWCSYGHVGPCPGENAPPPDHPVWAREGDIIEKLREAIKALPCELRWEADTLLPTHLTAPPDSQVWVQRSEVLAALNDLQEQSTGGGG